MLAGKEARSLYDRRLDLHDVQSLDRVSGDRSGSDPASQADHEDPSRVWVYQQREMAQHELGWHIIRRRGVGLPVDPEENVPAEPEHRYRAADPIAIKEDLAPLPQHIAQRPVANVLKIPLAVHGGAA